MYVCKYVCVCAMVDWGGKKKELISSVMKLNLFMKWVIIYLCLVFIYSKVRHWITHENGIAWVLIDIDLLL